MRRFSVLAAALVMVPAFAFAHVTVAPRVSKPGAEEKYTVRVPTEGKVATMSVYLEVPDGVTVTDVPHPEGATHEVKKVGDRIVAITWTKEIPPKQRAEFVFTTRNPGAEGQITWKIQQRYSEGKPSDWTPGTKLTGPLISTSVSRRCVEDSSYAHVESAAAPCGPVAEGRGQCDRQVQLTQPCSAHIPHDSVTRLFSASRALNTRTPALLGESPCCSANALTDVPCMSMARNASA